MIPAGNCFPRFLAVKIRAKSGKKLVITGYMEVNYSAMKWMIAAVSVCLLISACASEEHKREMEYFDDGNAYFAKDKFDPSQKSYQKLLDESPDSPFRIHSLLGSADAYYLEGEYIASAPVYARFVELYPQDELTPHALFYEAMSYYRDMVALKKDQTNAGKALEIFTEFARKYPMHFATPFVLDKITSLNDRLAEKEFEVALFYFKTTAYISCISRVNYLLEKWPHTRFKADALMLKGKSYLAEEAFDKGNAVLRQLVADFPTTGAGIEAATLLAAKP